MHEGLDRSGHRNKSLENLGSANGTPVAGLRLPLGGCEGKSGERARRHDAATPAQVAVEL
jgi:hypothetical protein